MARLHIIYDPQDKISTNPEMERHTHIKTATLSIPENTDGLDFHQTASKLIELLLLQVRLGD